MRVREAGGYTRARRLPPSRLPVPLGSEQCNHAVAAFSIYGIVTVAPLLA